MFTKALPLLSNWENKAAFVPLKIAVLLITNYAKAHTMMTQFMDRQQKGNLRFQGESVIDLY